MNLKNIFKYMDVVVGFSLDWMGGEGQCIHQDSIVPFAEYI